MKGSIILINGVQPNGRFVSGIISGTVYPGMQCEMVPGTEPVNGVFTYRPCSTAGKKGPAFIALEDENQGVVATEAYVAGTLGRFYCPIHGDELNLLFEVQSGTGDNFAIGDLACVNNAGKFIATTGTPYQNQEVEETVAALSADTLIACRWS